MKIGIDIDNTICKTNLMINEIYRKLNNGKDIYSLSKLEQYKFTGDNGKDVFKKCILEDNVIEVINYLASKNEIYFITARSNKYVKDVENITINYLNKNNIKYNNIYFGHDSKLDIYKKLGIDIMLDDDYDVYKEITEDGYEAVLYNGLFNKNKQGIRVNNWLEFKDFIERKENDG